MGKEVDVSDGLGQEGLRGFEVMSSQGINVSKIRWHFDGVSGPSW